MLVELKDLLNFTSGVADQDFSDVQLKRALNKRYALECILGQQHGKRTWFHKQQTFTWPASEETLQLPQQIEQAGIYHLEDITDRDPGYPLPAMVFWLDNKTLQWGDTSPGTARTIRATYFARPGDMVAEHDEPDLIPPEHRMLIVWSAAVFLRQKADEGAPPSWMEQLNEERLNFWKAMSKGRPSNGTGTGSLYDIHISGAQVDQDGSSINQDNN